MRTNVIVAFVFLSFFSCSSDDATCVEPTNLVTIFSDETRIAVGWSYDVKPASYTVEFGLEGFSLGTGTRYNIPVFIIPGISNGFSRSALIERLATNTSYDYYVRVNCQDGSSSNFTGPGTINTLAFGEGCTPPSDLVPDEITSNSIRISWNGYDEDLWDIELFEIGTDSLVNELAHKNTHLFENLNPSTNYQVKVKTICDEFFEFSDELFSPRLEFSTLD